MQMIAGPHEEENVDAKHDAQRQIDEIGLLTFRCTDGREKDELDVGKLECKEKNWCNNVEMGHK